MKNVLCYGDSNTWGCIPLEGTEPARRLPPAARWPGILRHELGDGYWVVEEGLNGRTTVWNDALEPHRNGRELLLPTLLTHQPLDVVIIMLGTNDLKRRIGVSAHEIAEGAGMLADVVAGSGCGPNSGAPQVLLVCPPPVARLDQFADEFEGAAEKSRELARHFAVVAEARSCAFLDAGTSCLRATSTGSTSISRSTRGSESRSRATFGSSLAEEPEMSQTVATGCRLYCMDEARVDGSSPSEGFCFCLLSRRYCCRR